MLNIAKIENDVKEGKVKYFTTLYEQTDNCDVVQTYYTIAVDGYNSVEESWHRLEDGHYKFMSRQEVKITREEAAEVAKNFSTIVNVPYLYTDGKYSITFE